MKKIFLLSILLIVFMTGCGVSEGSKNYYESTNNTLHKIPDNENLYYDINTNIVYIIFNEEQNAGYASVGYGYMSPYYASNGKPYKYIDGKMEEIR